MGKKGDKASKAPWAKELYAQGKTLTEIAVLVNSSMTSLSRWKTDTKDPNKDVDEWEQALIDTMSRQKFIDEMRKTFDEYRLHFNALAPVEITTNNTAILKQIYSVVRQLEEDERAENARIQAATQEQHVDIDRPALFLEFLEWISAKLKEKDPEGLKILVRNFEGLVDLFKAEHAKG